MATSEQAVNDSKDNSNYVFVAYLPICLHEEEVTCVEDGSSLNLPLEVVSEVVMGNKDDVAAYVTANVTDSVESGGFNGDESKMPVDGCHFDNNILCRELLTEKKNSNMKGKNIKKYGCNHCRRLFISHEKLLRHVKVYHKENVQVRLDRDGKRCWVCENCNKTFISRKGAIIHQRTHTGERPYVCEICSKRFIDSSTLMKHQVIHQAIRPFTCQICKRGFNQKVALQRHERTHSHEQTVYICKHCPKTFLVMSSLQAHEKIHSGVKPFSCAFCLSTFHTSTALRQHERVHTNERPYICSNCGKAFKDAGTLSKHEVIHSSIKPFVCPLCSQGFTQKIALKIHIRSHVTKLGITCCSLCKKSDFSSKDELCDHFEKHIEECPKISNVSSELVSSKSLKLPSVPTLTDSDLTDLTTLCDVAISTARNITFSSNNNNNNNVKGDNNLNNRKSSNKMYQYSCNECGMGSEHLKSLNSHTSDHIVTCKHCDKVSSDKILIEEHDKFLVKSSIVNCHSSSNSIVNNNKLNKKRLSKLKGCNSKLKSSNKRQFHCEKCDKYFSSRNGYTIHQRSHTGERPYQCRWCDKAFGDSATRHKHERIHTGERPFKCLQCPRAFNQRAALRAHQITHSADRAAFVCPYCGSSFPYSTSLKKHCDAFHYDRVNVICPLCKLMMSDFDDLHKHIKNTRCKNNRATFTEGVSQKCGLCNSGLFTDIFEFSDHIVWHARQIVHKVKSDKISSCKNSPTDVDSLVIKCN